MSARLGWLLTAALWCSCKSPMPEFGAPCEISESCATGWRCVDARCVPARQPGDAGDTCANPLTFAGELVNAASPPLVLETGLAGANADYRPSCAAAATPDVVLAFSVGATLPVRIRAEQAHVTLSLRRLDEGRCDLELPDACAADEELLVERVETLAAGSWAVIVSGGSPVDEVVRVTVAPIDCPAGYLPFGPEACAGFRATRAPNSGRMRALLTALPDGRALLSGGLLAPEEVASGAEGFEPAGEVWTFVTTSSRLPPHAAVMAGERLILAGGGLPPEILLEEQEEDVTQLVRVEPDDGGLGITDFEAPVLAAGLPSGVFALVTNYNSYLLRLQQRVDKCPGGICARPEGICVQDPDIPFNPGICICPSGPCLGAPLLGGGSPTSGERAEGLAARQRPIVGGVANGREFVAVHDGDKLYQLDVEIGHWRSAPVVARDEVGLTAMARGTLVIGGREAGAPSARVELIDASLQAGNELGPLKVARTRHGQTTLPDGRVLVVGGTGVDEVALTSAELLDPSTGTTSRLPSLPMPLAEAQAVTLADGRVLVLGAPTSGGALTSAWLFEALPRGAKQPDPPRDACGLIIPIAPQPVDATPAPALVEETTVGERDRFRNPSCGLTIDSRGPERLFSFTIGEPSSLYATTNLQHSTFVLWRGDCLEHEGLGCATISASADPPGPTALAPSLAAGSYILVVEAHTGDAHGTGFALDARLGAPGPCARDAADPADDTPAGARPLLFDPLLLEPTPADGSSASGQLCGDDVDHLILERWSSSSQVWLENAARDASTLAPAIIDDAATLAAGVPVYSFGPPLPFGDGESAPGIFLVALRLGEGDAFQHHWELSNFPDICVPDAVDSLAPVLDDGHHPGRRVALPPSGELERCLTSDVDIDVTVAALPADLDLIAHVDDNYSTTVQFFALSAPDAPLGVALSDPAPNTGYAVAIGGSAPYVAMVTRTEEPSGETHHLVVESEDLSLPCDLATPLSDSGTADYDSTLYPALLDPTDFGDCTEFAEVGSEMVGALVLRAGDVLDAELEPTDDGDVALYLLTSCIIGTPACVAGVDEEGASDMETLHYEHQGPEQTLYLVSDSYSDEPCTATLRWTVTRAAQ